VLRGQFSNTYRRDTLWLMRRLLPRGTFVEVEGADHFVPMSQPEKTAALIGQFILSLPEAKRHPVQ
jgi:pimeloyl-ACP methyl ester carboxylesterase